jgi:hypothetical protein
MQLHEIVTWVASTPRSDVRRHDSADLCRCKQQKGRHSKRHSKRLAKRHYGSTIER